MRPLTKTFAAAALLAAVSLTAAGCDTSPYAARVNSHVIKQTQLNAELSSWSSNKQYVAAFDSAQQMTSACQANPADCVFVVGDAPGTYNSTWAASILGNVIIANLTRQRLQTLHQVPDQATVDAARAVSEISQIGWTSFSPAFRNVLTARLADDATLTPTTVDAATLQRVYNQYLQYFFSQVCVLQAAAFSLQQAQQLSDSGAPGGSQVCFNQAQFENQSAQFRQAVMSLDVNKTSQPIKTNFGFQVVEVVSRAVIGFTSQVQRTLSVAIVNAQGAPNPAVEAVVVSARVKVNPEYGTWNQGQVTPPKTPGSSQSQSQSASQ